MKAKALLTMGVSAILLLSFISCPVSAETSNSPALSKNRATPQPAAQKANTITQAALKNGVRTCGANQSGYKFSYGRSKGRRFHHDIPDQPA
jgi:hypothetical protein